jgi:hypothetical protein
MCHHVYGLTPEEKKDVRKLSGIMIPVYAATALAVIAVIALVAATGLSPQGKMAASASAPAVPR